MVEGLDNSWMAVTGIIAGLLLAASIAVLTTVGCAAPLLLPADVVRCGGDGVLLSECVGVGVVGGVSGGVSGGGVGCPLCCSVPCGRGCPPAPPAACPEPADAPAPSSWSAKR